MPTYKYLNDTGLERTLNKLKAYIDSQSGGGSDGHGFIICDTSTMQVGDKIRVRSVYTVLEEPYNQTKEVVTVGQPVTFTVPCYDYYKICTVQTIDDTPTEIGGMYTTIDVGQTVYVNVLDKTTLGGIQGILNAHQETELLNIGDEVNVTVNGADWTMLVGGINLNDTHEVIFVSKYLWDTSAITDGNFYNSGSQALRLKMQSFYSALTEKAYLKDTTKCCRYSGSTASWQTFSDYVYPPTYLEVTGNSAGGTPTVTLRQYPIFTTQSNRIRSYNGTVMDWWTCDGNPTTAGNFNKVSSSGGTASSAKSSALGALPCFRLTADS